MQSTAHRLVLEHRSWMQKLAGLILRISKGSQVTGQEKMLFEMWRAIAHQTILSQTV